MATAFERPVFAAARPRAARRVTLWARVFATACALASAHCGTDAPRENFGRARGGKAEPANVRADMSREAGVRDAGARHDDSSDDAAARAHDAPAGVTRDAGSSGGAPATDASGGPAAMDGGTDADPARAVCGAPPVTSGAFSRERLREASADCAIHRYCTFDFAAQALESAVNDWAKTAEDSQLSAARDAWRQAMDAWSRAELFQFGPAASAAQSAGKDSYEGQGLRDRIYGWPASARCRVEQEIVDRTDNLVNVLVSGRGLFALEYVLFYEGADTECAQSSQTAEAWGALGTDEIAARKAAYAVVVARDVRAQAQALVEAWSPSGGNFRQTFVSAGGKYPSEQEALNVLGWALVYVEKEVKDWKLGIPAGVTQGAPVTGPEAPFAHTGSENIRANLRAFRQLFEGCGEGGEGIGFDDWLSEAGHGELGSELVSAWEASQAAADALPPLHEATPAELSSMYETLRRLTTLLKGDLFGAGSPLNLKLPASVEGDTD